MAAGLIRQRVLLVRQLGAVVLMVADVFLLLWCCRRMSAFTHIRDRLDDIRVFSSATMSIIKLIIGAALVINLLAGVW